MKTKWLDAILFFTTLLSGFYGGIGFFGYVGFNPTLARLPEKAFVAYWQILDHFMGSRMPVFAPSLLLLILASTVLLKKSRFGKAAGFMLLALIIFIGDGIFTFTVNHPYNQLIQSWDINELPSNVEQVKMRVVEAFNYRGLFMIGSFIGVLLSVWEYKKTRQKS